MSSLIGGSESRTFQTTNVSTNTTSKMGDVGFTGAAGVELAAVLQSGVTAIATTQAGTLEALASYSGDSIRESFRTANTLAEGGFNLAAQTIKAQQESGNTLTAAASKLGDTVLTIGRDIQESATSGPAAQFMRQLPMIAVIIVVGVVLMRMGK